MRTRTRIIIGIVIAVGALAAVGIYLFLKDDAPPPVTLDDAVESLTGGSAPGDPTPPGGDGVEGTWDLDNDEDSFAGYRIDEQLDPIGANTAAGRSPGVTGTLVIDGTSITTVDIEVDMTQLASDNGSRDNQLRGRGLQTDTFPTATFSLTSPIELGALPADGETIAVDAVGDLTIHGETNEVTITIEALLVGDVVVVTGSTPIVLADYAIDAPTGFRVLSIADDGEMEFQLFFTRA